MLGTSLLSCVVLMGVSAVPTPESWLRSEWEAARGEYSFPGVEIRYTIDLSYVPPAEELAALRREVQGKPDHPGWHDLEIYDRRLRDGPDRINTRLWLANGEWRASESANASHPAFDYGTDGDVSWSLSSNTLNLVDSDSPPPQRDYRGLINSNVLVLSKFLHGHIGIGEPKRAVLREIHEGSRRWTAVAEGDGFRAAFEGRWSEELGRGFVERMVIEQDRPQFIGEATEFRDWHYDDLLGKWIAGRVVERRPDGLVDKVLVFESSAPVTPAEFDALVAAPRLDRPDPIRGDFRVSTVSDFRAHSLTESTISSEGNVVETRSLPGRRASLTARRLGWAILVVLAMTFVVVRIRNAGKP